MDRWDGPVTVVPVILVIAGLILVYWALGKRYTPLATESTISDSIVRRKVGFGVPL